MSRITRRKFLIIGGALLGAPFAGAVAQQQIARVGWVILGTNAQARPRQSALEGFRAGLRERGWIEGKNILVELRAGDRSDAAAIARDLIATKTDIIFADGGMVNGLKSQVSEIPIVFTMSGDPREAKWVASLSRPGGNVTGMSSLQLELEAKRLELLKEIRPRMTRVALFGNERHPGYAAQRAASEAAARQFGLTFLPTPVRTAEDFGTAFEAMRGWQAEAILVYSDSLVNNEQNARAIAEFAAHTRMATASAWPSFAEAGNLLAYGPNEREFHRRAASYIDRILRGAKPAELPVEFPTRLELTVNSKTARTVGLTIPQSVLTRADRVIE